MTWQGLRGTGVTHGASPLDSRRFGLGVGRVVVGVDTTDAQAAATELTDTLRRAPEKVLVVRWPSGLVRLGSAAAASGRIIIPADVLTYWEVAPDQFRPPRDDVPGLATIRPRELEGALPEVVASVVRSSFADYGSHYAANPMFDPALALAGYVEWATSSLATPGADLLLFSLDDIPVGIATVEAGAGGDLEVLLCGLSAEAQGRGLYHHLLHEVARFAQRAGHDRLIISTQAQNVRAQRVWARAGLRPFAALTTVHAVDPDMWRLSWPH